MFETQRKFLNDTIIKPIASNLASALLLVGILCLGVGIHFGNDTSNIENVLSDFFTKSGGAILGAGVFAVIMKSAQFTDLFQKHIYDVFYDPSKVKEGDELIVKWRAITNFLLRGVLPTTHKNAADLIEQQFFNSEVEYHFEDYRIEYSIEIDSGTNIAKIRSTTRANIILSPNVDNPVLIQTYVIKWGGTNELKTFLLNGKELPTDLYKTDPNNPDLHILNVPLKNYAVSGPNGQDRQVKMERTVVLTQDLKKDPYIKANISRYIKGATVSIKQLPNYTMHFERFGLGELPEQHYLKNDGRDYERWTLATPDDLLLPGQGYIIMPLRQ